MARKRVKRSDCPNCGRSLLAADNYCPSCGQENHTHKLPVRHFIVELLSGLFNFDTKLIRTLRDLFWPPGLVIREFNANKRERYVHPLRLYLFTSLLFFLCLAWSATHLSDGEGPVITLNSTGSGSLVDEGLTLDLGTGIITDSSITALSARTKVSDHLIDSTLYASGVKPTTGNRILLRLAVNLSGSSFKKEEFVQRVFSTFSKLLFLLVPLFALLLKVVYRRSGNFYTEHLVFALYFHTVVFLILMVRILLGEFVHLEKIELVFSLLPVTLLFWTLHTVHGNAWWRTSVKGLLLLVSYIVFLALGLSIAALAGALAI